MKLTSILTVIGLANFVVAIDYTPVGAVIFGRHGDRTSKPNGILTPLGARTQYQVGQFYRERYFGNESEYKIENFDPVYNSSQFYGESKEGTVVYFSQLAFLQGLYPPLGSIDAEASEVTASTVSNGTVLENELDGYQYVLINVKESETEENIRLTGDESCPTYDTAVNTYLKSDSFTSRNESTLSFYQGLSRQIVPKSVYPDWKMNFANSYNIYDYINTRNIHNKTYSNLVSDDTMFQLRTLADEYSYGVAFDEEGKNEGLTIGARTLLSAISQKLNTTRYTGAPYLSLFTGSYDTMMQINGITDLHKDSVNFTGLPDYSSTYVFDLLKDDSDEYYVQFSFKNGTGPLNVYRIFGENDTVIPLSTFQSHVSDIGMSKVSTWCNYCNSEASFCAAYSDLYTNAKELEEKGYNVTQLADGKYHISKSNLTLAGAGGIGAGVTIFVFGLLASLLFILYRSKSKKNYHDSSSVESNADLEKATSSPSH